jgi:hypothetical protein
MKVQNFTRAHLTRKIFFLSLGYQKVGQQFLLDYDKLRKSEDEQK